MKTLGFDPDDTNLTYIIPEEINPEYGSIDDSNLSNGIIEFIPKENYDRTASLLYQVCDDASEPLCTENQEITIEGELVDKKKDEL